MPFLLERALINHPPSQPLCKVPNWITSLLYSASSDHSSSILAMDGHDISLAVLLEMLITTTDAVCPADKCGKPSQEHSTNLIHDNHKVSFTVKKSIMASPRQHEAVAFYKCNICSKSSQPVALSEASLLCSLS